MESNATGARRFTIYPGGVRKQPEVPKRFIHPGREKTKLAAQVAAEVQTLVDAGTAKNYEPDLKRVLPVWADFCALLDLDPDMFGRVGDAKNEELNKFIVGEGEILSHFLAYIRVRPKRERHKKPVSFATARSYLYTITNYYHELRGRRPAKFRSGKWAFQLDRTLKGIKSNAPLAKLRLPIMQQDLHKIRKLLNLRENGYHRVLWALWLAQWQAGCRASDFIRPANEQKRRWDPAKDLHRGRVSAQRALTSENKLLGVKLVVKMKPIKNDKRNERIVNKSFVIDTSPNALSAGAAIVHMLKEDPNSGDNLNTPLFRDPATKKEILYQDAAVALKAILRRAGLHELASGLHCLRIGGTTAVCAAKGGGEALAMRHGGWKSNVGRRYLFAGSAQLDEVTTRAARQKNVAIDRMSGPLGGRFQEYNEEGNEEND